jgi:hypothetical protein
MHSSTVDKERESASVQHLGRGGTSRLLGPDTNLRL